MAVHGNDSHSTRSGSAQGQMVRALALHQQGRISEGLEILKTLIQAYPDSPVLYNMTGVFYMGLGQAGGCG